MPDNVIGDPLRLQHIITTPVVNAIKFTENGYIDILVENRALSNTKVQIEVQIRDTGIGIPERDQSRLFQAFRQADASISRRHGGTPALVFLNAINRAYSRPSDRLMPVFPAVMVAPGWGW